MRVKMALVIVIINSHRNNDNNNEESCFLLCCHRGRLDVLDMIWHDTRNWFSSVKKTTTKQWQLRKQTLFLLIVYTRWLTGEVTPAYQTAAFRTRRHGTVALTMLWLTCRAPGRWSRWQTRGERMTWTAVSSAPSSAPRVRRILHVVGSQRGHWDCVTDSLGTGACLRLPPSVQLQLSEDLDSFRACWIQTPGTIYMHYAAAFSSS